MEKNKKVTLLILYLIVIFLWIFDLLCCWISIKQQVMHYTIPAQFALGESLTYFWGLYPWACLLFLIIPILFVCYSKKNMRTIFLGAGLFVVHLIIGVACIFWMDGMDNDGTYDRYGKYSSFENAEKGIKICVQNVYMDDPEDRGHSIIVLQTGINTLKKVRECNFTTYTHEVSCNWEKDRVTIYAEASDEDEFTIGISYDELRKAGAYID